MMGPVDATISCMTKPFRWRGRAAPSEYWWFALALTIFWIVLIVAVAWPLLMIAAEAEAAAAAGVPYDIAAMSQARVDAVFAGAATPILAVFTIWTSFASLAVTVRRLHDTGRSGWWYWISLVPMVGPIILLILMIIPGDSGRNDYGSPPGGPAPVRSSLSDVPAVPRANVDAARRAEEARALRLSRMNN
ncbi:DUF805 domain-containing protein [Jannaschia sp. KMU-145]|uniref:DUF805 domain-containing protein n=1 Tax=Jannaschia halovivens TaxID=3388667 RepID=UPI00396AF1DC